MNKLILASALLLLLFVGCTPSPNPPDSTYQYKPVDSTLHYQIVELDSIFFDAYNHCETKLDIYSSFYSDSLEFYHDKGGVSNSKSDVVSSTQKNICGKVTRELMKNSIEVYPIANYGAIELGLHRFHNNEEPNDSAHYSKFIIFWQYKNENWKINKVVSLH